MVHEGSLADAVDTYVTGPLGMDDSSFVVGDPERLAVPYADGDPRAVRMGEPHRVDDLVFSPARAFDERSFQSGGGGMVGTAGDFMRFLETWRLGGAPILTADTVEEASRNQVGGLRERDEPGWGFGFISGVLLDPQRASSPSVRRNPLVGRCLRAHLVPRSCCGALHGVADQHGSGRQLGCVPR